MSAKSEAWVCRIPREHLRALAKCSAFDNHTRVLSALLGELYEDFGKTGGVGPASLRNLSYLTGLHLRTVRRELDLLKTAGALVQVEAKPGFTTTYRLKVNVPVGADAAHTDPAQQPRTPDDRKVRTPRAESAHTPPSNLRTPPCAPAAHTKEEEELFEEPFEEGADAPGSFEPFLTSSFKVIEAKEGAPVACPSCHHGGKLDVAGGYRCMNPDCGQLYRVRWIPAPQPARRYA